MKYKYNLPLFILITLITNCWLITFFQSTAIAENEIVEKKDDKIEEVVPDKKTENLSESKELTKSENKESNKFYKKQAAKIERKDELNENLKTPNLTDFKPTDESLLFKNIDYPELQVVPRASDRLSLEAAQERDRKNSFFWTLQTPAVATFIAGLATYKRYQSEPLTDQQKIDHDRNSTLAMGVGIGWLGLNYYLMNMEPYMDGLSRINKIRKTDRRSELLRERLAEEVFERTAKTMRFVSHLSVITNSIAILGCVDKTSTDYSVALIIPFTISFFPYIFSQRYIDVYEKHQEYKRKIYAPISLFNLYYDNKSQTYTPVYGLAWNF